MITLPPGDPDCLTGEHMCNLLSNPDDTTSVRVDLERTFVTPPKIVPFFNYIDLSKDHGWRVYTTASDLDTNGFTLTIDTWSDYPLRRTGWLDHLCSGSRVYFWHLRQHNGPSSLGQTTVPTKRADFIWRCRDSCCFRRVELDGHRSVLKPTSIMSPALV